jgi:hypothetical protein
VALPQEDFDLIESAAVSKAPQRVINPRSVTRAVDHDHFAELLERSKEWGLDYDIFA